MKFFRLFSLCMVFVGTVVGAGFASGLEIWVFFGKYGIFGFSGVLLTGIVISLCGAGIILGVFDGDFTTHDEFCRKICGRYSGSFFSVLGIVFMFSAFSIMLSGSGALFSQEFGRSYCEGVIFMAVICFFVFIYGAKGLTAINLILTPLMLFGITFLGISELLTCDKSVSLVFSDLLTVSASWVSSVIYISYNLLSVPAVIIPLKSIIPSRKSAAAAGLYGGVLLGICAVLMYLSSLADGFASTTLPALTLASKHSRFFGIFYGITIYFSMLTTALGNGFGVLETIHSKFPVFPRKTLSAMLCITAFIIALSGFDTLVNKLYTVIGYCSVPLTFLLVSYSLKKLRPKTALKQQ